MKYYRILRCLIACIAIIGLLGIPVSATENDVAGGYVYNTETGELQAYKENPNEVLPDIQVNSEDIEPYIVNAPGTRSIGRAFISYSPRTYTYEYTNPKFKIGKIRVDNTANKYESASLVFVTENSSSCEMTYSAAMEVGGELQAIFGKASIKFGGEIARKVSWVRGTSVSTTSSVPPGEIGSVTAYVIGIYSAGTATYRMINTTTDEVWEENVGVGALIPTTNEWNLVVEIPSA